MKRAEKIENVGAMTDDFAKASVAVLALAGSISLRRTAPEPSDALEPVRSAAASGMRRTTPHP